MSRYHTYVSDIQPNEWDYPTYDINIKNKKGDVITNLSKKEYTTQSVTRSLRIRGAMAIILTFWPIAQMLTSRFFFSFLFNVQYLYTTLTTFRRQYILQLYTILMYHFQKGFGISKIVYLFIYPRFFFHLDGKSCKQPFASLEIKERECLMHNIISHIISLERKNTYFTF